MLFLIIFFSFHVYFKDKVEKAIEEAGMKIIESKTDNDWMAYVCQR